MKNWSEVNSRYGGNPHVAKYIGIYFAFGFGSSALVVLQTLILWIFCSIEVSTPTDPFRILTSAAVVHNILVGCAGNCGPGQWLTRVGGETGLPQVARKDGACHFPIAHELLRNNAERKDSEQIFEVSTALPQRSHNTTVRCVCPLRLHACMTSGIGGVAVARGQRSGASNKPSACRWCLHTAKTAALYCRKLANRYLVVTSIASMRCSRKYCHAPHCDIASPAHVLLTTLAGALSTCCSQMPHEVRKRRLMRDIGLRSTH